MPGLGTAMMKCGCSVTKGMGGDMTIYSVQHCPVHRHLFSDTKSLRQMAREIWKIHQPKVDD